MYQEEDEVELSFHRKYRPQSLTQYIGNDSIKRALLAALERKNKPQVLFYYGPAGCGKTTLARLTMMEYRCENRDPLRGACGQCHSCTQMLEYIETGKGDYLPNVQEVDATAQGGKSDIDTLLDAASEPTWGDEWKIFMLDECHELTVGAQNRLLKTLEEPNPNVLMILCTTDPDKMLEAILTRCQLKFEVTKPKRNELVPLLDRVCREEGVKYDKRALSTICVKGKFVPRQALILLENVITQAKEVTYNKTVEVLEIIAESYYFDFFSYLMADHIDPYRFISYLGRLKQDSVSMSEFISGLLEFTQRGVYVVNGADVEALDESEIKQYKKLFSRFDVRMIAVLLQRVIKLKYSKDIEAELMLLAYTGLFPQQDAGMLAPQGGPPMLDDSSNAEDVQKEKKTGRENHIASITPTAEQKEDFIQKQSTPVPFSELGKLFGRDIIVGPAKEPTNK